MKRRLFTYVKVAGPGFEPGTSGLHGHARYEPRGLPGWPTPLRPFLYLRGFKSFSPRSGALVTASMASLPLFSAV